MIFYNTYWAIYMIKDKRFSHTIIHNNFRNGLIKNYTNQNIVINVFTNIYLKCIIWQKQNIYLT